MSTEAEQRDAENLAGVRAQLEALMAELPTVRDSITGHVDLNCVTRDQQQRWGALVRSGVTWRASKQHYSRNACYFYKSARLHLTAAWPNGQKLISDRVELLVNPGWLTVRPSHRAVMVARLRRAGAEIDGDFGPWYDGYVLEWNRLCPHLRDYEAEAQDVMRRALAEIEALGFDVESSSNTDRPDVLTVENLTFAKRHKTADEKREATIDRSDDELAQDKKDAELDRTLHIEQQHEP